MSSIFINTEPTGIEYRRFEKMFSKQKINLTRNPESADAILFNGGADICPNLYGHKEHISTFTDLGRDEKDIALFDEYKDDKPMIGICRGAQLGHVLSGGYLIQDINNHYKDHEVLLHAAPRKYPSDHHQAMACTKVGDVLGISRVATSKIIQRNNTITNIQGVQKFDIEIMYHPDTRFLCMQAHPEYIGYPDCTEDFFKLLKKIFNIS